MRRFVRHMCTGQVMFRDWRDSSPLFILAASASLAANASRRLLEPPTARPHTRTHGAPLRSPQPVRTVLRFGHKSHHPQEAPNTPTPPQHPPLTTTTSPSLSAASSSPRMAAMGSAARAAAMAAPAGLAAQRAAAAASEALAAAPAARWRAAAGVSCGRHGKGRQYAVMGCGDGCKGCWRGAGMGVWVCREALARRKRVRGVGNGARGSRGFAV